MSLTLAWIAGILMCANAAVHLFVLCCHPAFRSGEWSAGMDPTTGYTSGSQEAAQLLAQNPDMAKKAGSFAYEQAKQNPQYAAQVSGQLRCRTE
jgi:hypothetical protein